MPAAGRGSSACALSLIHICAGNKGAPKEVLLGVLGEQDPGRLVEQICQSANLPYESKQEILEQRTVSRQVEKLVIALEREINVLLIEKDIYDKVRVQLDQNQREYVLREQMHIISEELGEDGRFDRCDECFSETWYAPEFLQAALEEAGFALLQRFDGYRDRPVTEKSQRVVYLAKKEGK